MKAITFDGKLSVTERPAPRREEGEALIRVRLAGICNTDIEILRGYMDFRGILGHEFVGIVEKCDDPKWTGRRVVGEINLPCRQCDLCERGLEKHCRNRSVLGLVGKDGVFAEYLTLPVSNLHAVDDAISDEQAVFVEPLAACFEMIGRRVVSRDDKIAVLGDGKLGALAAQVMKTTGGDVTLIGKHPEKLARIAAPGIRSLLSNENTRTDYDVVAECTGSARGFLDAMQLVRPRGVIFLKTTVSAGEKLNLSPLVVDEITVIGSRCGPFEPALAGLARREVAVDRVIDEIMPADRALEAFRKAQAPGVMKVLLDFRDNDS